MSLLHVMAIASGLAIVLLAAAVLWEIDLRAGNWAGGVAWLAAVGLAGNLTLQGFTGAPLSFTTVGMASVFAVLGWRYRGLLFAEARGPAERRTET